MSDNDIAIPTPQTLTTTYLEKLKELSDSATPQGYDNVLVNPTSIFILTCLQTASDLVSTGHDDAALNILDKIHPLLLNTLVCADLHSIHNGSNDSHVDESLSAISAVEDTPVFPNYDTLNSLPYYPSIPLVSDLNYTEAFTSPETRVHKTNMRKKWKNSDDLQLMRLLLINGIPTTDSATLSTNMESFTPKQIKGHITRTYKNPSEADLNIIRNTIITLKTANPNVTVDALVNTIHPMLNQVPPSIQKKQLKLMVSVLFDIPNNN